MQAPLFATQAPKPAKPKAEIQLVGDELHITWRQRSWGVVFFMSLWQAAWTTGCLAMVGNLIQNFDWFLLLFFVPFFVAWLGVGAFLIIQLFGRQQLTLSRDRLHLQRRALITYSERTVDIGEVARAGFVRKRTHTDEDELKTSTYIRIETLGEPIDFADSIKKREGDWLAETINICLDHLAPQRPALDSRFDVSPALDSTTTQGEWPQSRPEYAAATSGRMSARTLLDGEQPSVVFVPPAERLTVPSGSTWSAENLGRELLFTKRCDWSLVGIVVTTGMCLFWNGIVGVFLWQLVRNFVWPLALFMVPFVIVGLGFLFVWFGALTAPWWRMSYGFRLGCMERTLMGPMFRLRNRFEFGKLARIEFIAEQGQTETPSLSPPDFVAGSGDVTMYFIDVQDDVVARINGLTRGDALWIADRVTSERPELFARQP